MPYEILSHTADVRVKATGKSKAGLYTEMLRGMFAATKPQYLLRPESDVQAPVERPFSIEATNAEDLLVRLLNEAIRLSAQHHESYETITFTLVTDVKAEGAFVDRPVTQFGTQLQAATHHGLKIQKNVEGLWEATVTFGQ